MLYNKCSFVLYYLSLHIYIYITLVVHHNKSDHNFDLKNGILIKRESKEPRGWNESPEKLFPPRQWISDMKIKLVDKGFEKF